jgi:hypothetical protein
MDVGIATAAWPALAAAADIANYSPVTDAATLAIL